MTIHPKSRYTAIQPSALALSIGREEAGKEEMTPIKQAFGKYWIIYYLVYVVSVAVFLWFYRDPVLSSATTDVTRLYLLAAIFGVSAGIALLVTIFMEVIIVVVLLAPRVWRHAVNQGRQEERKRVKAIIAEHVKRDPKTGQLIISEEGQRLLNGYDQPS